MRAPSGLAGAVLFQRHAGTLRIPELRLLDPEISPDHEPMIEIDSFAALIGAAQANVIEFHTWNATIKDVTRPDRILFDLDPGEGVAWRQMQEGANLTRALLDQLGLKSFLKTSGGKGLHVVVPITPKDDWDTVKALAKSIVEHMAQTLPGALRRQERTEESRRPDLRRLPSQRLRRDHGVRLVGARPARPRRLGAVPMGRARGADERRPLDDSQRARAHRGKERRLARLRDDTADDREGKEGDRLRVGRRLRPASQICVSEGSRPCPVRAASTGGRARHNRPMSESLHLVDTTMFWSPTGGGVRRYLQTKNAWLARQPRWRHTIAVPRVAAGDAGVAILPSIALPGSGGYRLPFRRAAIARVLSALAPDVIEAGDPYRVAWAARDAAQALGIPAVAYCHSNLVALARLAGGRRFGAAAARAAERYARHVYAGFDLVLAPSRSMAAHLDAWGVGRVACQPLGVDTALFHPARRDPAWRERHGYSAATRLLVYAGRFAPEKRLDVLVDAVRRLGAPYALLAIGAGPTPPPAAERVVVLPFVASAGELATALASADAFVHAGDQETFGLSVLEAMACGTPAIVRAAEGLAELVDGTTGSAVAGGSGADFAAAIAAFFAGDRDAAAARAIAVRRRAEASDWQRVLPGFTAHYLRLIGAAADHHRRRAGDDPARA